MTRRADLDGATEPAYYAGFDAARAALSEEDLPTRRMLREIFPMPAWRR